MGFGGRSKGYPIVADSKDRQSRRTVTPRENAPAEKVAVLKMFGQILGNVNLYGLEHRITMNTLETSFEKLTALLAAQGSLSITMTESDFRVDGKVVPDKLTMLDAFRERLKALHAGGFTLNEGMTADEFVRLVMVLALPSTGGDEAGSLSEQLRGAGVTHIQSRVASVVEVGEDELVVQKDEVEEAGYGEAVIDQIVAFLRGEPSGGDSPLANIDKAAENPEELSDLIMQAVDVQRSPGNLADGESLGDIVVGCLRRAYDGLCRDKAFETKKGKKQVAKTLALMEESLLKKLRDFAGDAGEDAAEAVAETCEELREDVRTESLASDYAKRKEALEKAEQRILRHLKRQDADQIEKSSIGQKLAAGGLSPTQWQEFLIRSSKVPDVGLGGGDAVAGLATVLSQLESVIESVGRTGDTDQTSQSIAEAVARVSQVIDTSASHAEEKIQALQDLARDARDADEGEDPEAGRKQRRSMLAFLGEIAQELRQPLAVISTTIDMLQRIELDAARQAEMQMLQLAHSSTERMDHLIARLTEVVGFPRDLTPDENIVADIYR